MENNGAGIPDELKKILIDMSSDEVTVHENSKEGKLEFDFETEKKGLVFEDEDAFSSVPLQSETAPSAETVNAAPEAKEESDKTASADAPEAEAPDTEYLKEEFSLPDNFDAEESEAEIYSDDSTKIWSAYLPRFTEVSETYRMSDDPRPRLEKTEKTVVASDSTDSKPQPYSEELDPTEEIEESISLDDVVVVNINQKAEEPEKTFSVYKFSEIEKEEPSAPKERTVEDERREIEELVRRAPEVEEVIAEPLPQSEPAEMPQPKKAPRSYKLPDPETSRNLKVIDFPTAAKLARVQLAEAPEGAEESVPVNKKGRLTEYTALMQRDVFKDKFLDSIMSAKIRLAAAAIITLFMLLFENIHLFNADFMAFLRIEMLPGAMAVADLQFALCVCALAAPEILRAVRSLFKGKLHPEILMIFSLVITVVYTLVIFFAKPLNAEYPLFGTLLAIQAISAILATCFKRSADFISFKRVSGGGEKKILDKKMTRTLERENMALDGAVDEYKSMTARIFKTSFVSDFFKRSAKTVENSMNLLLIMSAALLAALVGGIVAFFIGNGWVSAAETFAAIALLTCPAASCLVHKLPFYHSELECDCEESAAVGESSLYEYSGVDVIAFEDTEIFGTEDVNLKRIIHYGDVDNMMKAMRQMAAIFANAGGPLGIIFSNSLDRKCSPAANPIIELDGLSGEVDGHTVCAGTEEYMLRHGIRVPDDIESSRIGVADSTKVMYGAEDGVIYAKFHIRYSFSEEFTMLLPSLREEKIVPIVYTRDPNINNELMRTLTRGDDCIRVLKKRESKIGEDKTYRRISAGIVTSGDKINAINVILLSKKYKKLESRLSLHELIVAGGGLTLSVILAIAGTLGAPSLFFFGWQAIWCVALYILSRKTFAIKKKDDKNDA